ncbi:hypothetical protein [Tumebacillus avium]|uniref:hypothetical protein n=1 Tax=Tumebacillus avium TaxID=1903704 RepID=UPI0012FDBFBA|nr:hypothetical protein [Tumebacillus avium]
MAEKPTALPVDELYSADYVSALVQQAEKMAAALNQSDFPTELTNVHGRMKQELTTAHEKMEAGALTQAVVTATNAQTYAFGMQKYLDFRASAEQTKQQTTALLAELEQDLNRQKTQVEQLDRSASDYATFALLTVLEKQLGGSLLQDTRASWDKALQEEDAHQIFTTFMNLGNLQYQRDRVDLLLKQAQPAKPGTGDVRNEVGAWLEREIPALQAKAEQKVAAYPGDVHQGYRAAHNAVSQAEYALQELKLGHTAYALELYLSAQADYGTAEQLERVGTQASNQQEIPLTELAELRREVLAAFEKTTAFVKQETAGGSDYAWYLSKLYDANAQIVFADKVVETKVLTAAAPDKVDVGQAYQMLVAAQAICQLIESHVQTGIDLEQGNLESNT